MSDETPTSANPARLSVEDLRETLEAAVAESGVTSERIEQMEAYMRNQFTFLGLTSPILRKAVKPFLASGRDATGVQILAAAHDCWQQPEREFQSAGALLTRKWADKLTPEQLEARPDGDGPPSVDGLITARSWWDTVDSLAPWTVGPLVAANPELVSVMDRWIDSDNIWLARTALLHQLGYRERTDADRVFDYAARRAEDGEFFIRKAIGWSLRQHARRHPGAVKRFVAVNQDRLSGLSKREALKHIG